MFHSPKVFLSHSKVDSFFIEKLYSDLKKFGIRPWLDSEDIRPGEPWLDAIFKSGIPTCDCVLVYLTGNSIPSKMVQKEIDTAIIQKLKENSVGFLPYIEDVGDRNSLRSDLQSIQIPELNFKNYDKIFPNIVLEIWNSYSNCIISSSIKHEQEKLFEAELELKKLKGDNREELTEDEEIKFEYIHNIFRNEDHIEGLKVDGDNQNSSNELINIPILFENYINLGYKEFLKSAGFNQNSVEDYIKFLNKSKYRFIDSIKITEKTVSYGIIATAILSFSEKSFQKRHLRQKALTILNMVNYNSPEAKYLLVDTNRVLDQVIYNFLKKNFIEFIDEDDYEIIDSTSFFIKNNKRPNLDRYRRSIIPFFCKYSFLAIAILEYDRFVFSSMDIIDRYKFIEKMFEHSFFYKADTDSENSLALCINCFINEKYIIPNPTDKNKFNLTTSGFSELRLIASFLTSSLESFKTTLLYFQENGGKNHDEKERLKKIYITGTKLYKNKTISLKESLSLANYEAAIKYFSDENMNDPTFHERIEALRKNIDSLLILIQR